MAYLQGFTEETEYLQSLFATGWAGKTTIQWPNTKADPPDREAWVRFQVRHSGADAASVGPNPMHRHDGTVIVEVFAPKGLGEATLNELCDRAMNIYRDHRGQQGLRFRTPYVREVGAADGWYRKNVLCPFARDTVFS